MNVIESKGKKYRITDEGFLENFNDWDEDFAEAMGTDVEIPEGLSPDHWHVIHYIHDALKKEGRCPRVYDTCRAMKLGVQELKRLFPTGYLRGACKLAGITYKAGYVGHSWLIEPAEAIGEVPAERIYRVDAYGFLIDSNEWDEQYASQKAAEMKMPNGLTDTHWQIIRFLRAYYERTGEIPNVYITCEQNDVNLETLERLFPDGYHRGAVKIAGLKVV
jgi:tRNA 2-thiouridine synthesizing protein E